MSRPIGERIKDWSWWGDQALHMFVVPLGVVVPWLLLGDAWTASTFSAFWIGGVREVCQINSNGWPVWRHTDETRGEHNSGEVWDALIDWAVTTAGGPLLVSIWFGLQKLFG